MSKTATTKPVRTAIYVRISSDPKGEGLGVDRQLKACRKYVAERGWTEVEVFEDNDKSATNKKKARPAYLRMLAAMEAREVDAVVVWDQDRLVRQPVELEHFISLADQRKIDLGTITGFADLATPAGRMFARMLGAYAAYEGEHKSERMRAKWAQNAEAGKPWMGGPRPYGYAADRVSAEPTEAEFIREAAKRVLAGESLRSVAASMNANGATTTGGKQWTGPTLRQVLRSARISGRREVFPEGVSATKGIGVVVADKAWEPIISPEDSDRLRALFSNPERLANHTRNTRAKHLLTGLLACDRCGGRMYGLVWERGGKPGMYRCPSPSTQGKATCGRTSVLMKHVEPVVRDVVMEAMDSPDFRDRLHARAEVDPKVAEQVDKDEATLTELAAAMATGELTMGEWKTARDIVKTRLERNKATLARVTNTNALALMDAHEGTLAEKWEALSVAQRRAVLGEVVERVRVLPAEGRGLKFSPRRLVPEFRF